MIERDKNRNLFLQHLGKTLENGRFEYRIIQDNNFDIDTIRYSVVSCFATWSGYTYLVGKSILEQLSLNEISKIPLILLDADYVSVDIQEKLFNSRKWGYFESCWIENGKILKRYKYKKELEEFIEYVKTRLSDIQER